MEQTVAASTLSIRFVSAVLAVCLAIFGVMTQLAGPSSSATTQRPALSSVELRALAARATLRVSASACGRVTHGSGVIIDGRLITNAHVVDGAIDVKADQPIAPVVVPVVSFDNRSDLAAAEQPVGVALVLASPAQVSAEAIVGRTVTLAGHADGVQIEIQAGVVSARVPGGAYGYGVDVLLIDAPTRGGYSGGPVLDDAGNLVAILSGFDQSTGLSVAVPADVIRDFLDLDATGGFETLRVLDDCGTR